MIGRFLRVLLGLSGIAVMAYGIDRLVHEPLIPNVTQVGEWLLGALILHDFVIAPFCLIVGFVVSKVVPARIRGVVQGSLVVMGAAVVITVPLLVKPVPSIPTVLPMDYAHNLTVVLSTIAAVMLALIVVRLVRRPTPERVVGRRARGGTHGPHGGTRGARRRG